MAPPPQIWQVREELEGQVRDLKAELRRVMEAHAEEAATYEERLQARDRPHT